MFELELKLKGVMGVEMQREAGRTFMVGETIRAKIHSYGDKEEHSGVKN